MTRPTRAYARAHRVTVIHCPLQQIPRPLLERNRRFRFLSLTRPQWNALLEELAEGKTAWLAPEAIARFLLASTNSLEAFATAGGRV